MGELIQLKQVNFSYDNKTKVINAIDFSISKGDRIAFIGKNGCGKTTLLKLISNVKKPTSGEINYNFPYEQLTFIQKFKYLITNNPNTIKKNFGYQFQKNNYPEDITIWDLFLLFDETKDKKAKKENILNLAKTYQAEHLLKRRMVELSGGQKQKINLILAIIHNPKILILDEISSGFDQETLKTSLEMVKTYIKSKDKTLLISSHNANEIKALTNRLVVISQGKIVATYNVSKMSLKKIEEILEKYASKFNDISKIFDFKHTKEARDYQREIKLVNLFKKYDDVFALEDINLDIKLGEKIGIIGHNGSGKSTLIEIISKTKKPSKGDILVSYENFEISVQFQSLKYPELYTLNELFYFVLRANKFEVDKAKMKKAFELFNISETWDKPYYELSGGQQQKFDIILALSTKPRLLILDELTTGLDINTRKMIISYLKTYLKSVKTTFLLITHNYEDLNLVDRVIILKKGRIFKDDLIKNIKFKELQKSLDTEEVRL